MSGTLDLADLIPQQLDLTGLADAVRAVAPPPRRRETDGVAGLFDAELRLGLEAADAARAYEAAQALWRRSGDLARCHASIERVVAATEAALAQGQVSRAHANRVASTALRVVAALRAQTPAGTGRRVVLLAPPGAAGLPLESLAHVVDDAGLRADVCGSLAAQEVAAAVVGATAVVLLVQRPQAGLAALVAAARRSAPQALIACAGPAARPLPGVDLATDRLPDLLDALRRGRCPLAERELEVLRCVADGLTNAEAAAVLGVSPATLKTHLDHVFDKTGTSGRAAAVAVALRQGWIR